MSNVIESAYPILDNVPKSDQVFNPAHGLSNDSLWMHPSIALELVREQYSVFALQIVYRKPRGLHISTYQAEQLFFHWMFDCGVPDKLDFFCQHTMELNNDHFAFYVVWVFNSRYQRADIIWISRNLGTKRYREKRCVWLRRADIELPAVSKSLPIAMDKVSVTNTVALTQKDYKMIFDMIQLYRPNKHLPLKKKAIRNP